MNLKRSVLWLAVLGYAGTIFYLSSLSNPLPELTSRLSDKALHAIEYGGLALLVMLALLASNIRPRRAVGIAIIAASVYGGSDEIHQAFVPGRDCDVRDWMADTLGAGAGAAIVLSARRRRDP